MTPDYIKEVLVRMVLNSPLICFEYEQQRDESEDRFYDLTYGIIEKDEFESVRDFKDIPKVVYDWELKMVRDVYLKQDLRYMWE